MNLATLECTKPYFLSLIPLFFHSFSFSLSVHHWPFCLLSEHLNFLTVNLLYCTSAVLLHLCCILYKSFIQKPQTTWGNNSLTCKYLHQTIVAVVNRLLWLHQSFPHFSRTFICLVVGHTSKISVKTTFYIKFTCWWVLMNKMLWQNKTGNGHYL